MLFLLLTVCGDIVWHFVSTEKECPIVEGHLSRAEFSRKILVLCLTLSNKKKNQNYYFCMKEGTSIQHNPVRALL